MKKVIIDLGANNGMSVDYFKNNIQDFEKYEVHCFECNPKFFPILSSKNVFLHKAAAWIKDEFLDFYIDMKDNSLGSTIIKNKKTGNLDKKNPLRVKAIDISKWIKENFNKEDYIVIKIDVEGAEYKIIEKMYKDKTLNYINKILGEFHIKKVGKTIEDVEKCKSMLREYNLIFIEHNTEKRR